MFNFFSNYSKRLTRIQMGSKTFCLCCESGYFSLYKEDGVLHSRSFRSLFKGSNFKEFTLSSLRMDERFFLVKISDTLWGIKELLSGVMQDYLVLADGSLEIFEEAMFLYVSLVMMNNGYNNKALGDLKTVFDMKRRIINIGNCIKIHIENCCAIFSWTGKKSMVQDISSLLGKLGIKCYCELKI